MNAEIAARQLEKIKACAETVGIGHAFFLGFGTLLGAIRENAIIGHDSDTDVCVMAELTTKEQDYAFYEELEKNGMFEYRRRRKMRYDNNRLLWISMKSVHPEQEGVKSCCWFWYPWNGYYWHSKGNRWVTKIGRRRNLPIDHDNTQAIAKGIPQECFDGFMKIKFYGTKYNIPRHYGKCLSYWYGDFMTPRKGGASTTEMLQIVGDWKDEHTWTMMPLKK